jgi:hypothetical protein
MKAPRRTGRPTTAAKEGKKATLGILASANLKRRLQEAAEVNGRSLSAEAEFRLERSFQEQDLLDQVLTLAFRPQTAGLLRVLAQTIGETVIMASRPSAAVRPEDWLSDPAVFASVKAAVARVFDRLRPAGDGVQVSRPGPHGPFLVGPGVADSVLLDVVGGSADSAADHARQGARIEEKLGPAATQRLKTSFEEQIRQSEQNQ